MDDVIVRLDHLVVELDPDGIESLLDGRYEVLTAGIVAALVSGGYLRAGSVSTQHQ
ncbi:hypothetical protein [Cryptosporangium sp. NPDC051539]|uniref:hypothetical protein n=1 Tax=Cryptosporangium sp. NPDC051539 TaxID=3363962 RepID=UPI0037A008CF